LDPLSNSVPSKLFSLKTQFPSGSSGSHIQRFLDLQNSHTTQTYVEEIQEQSLELRGHRAWVVREPYSQFGTLTKHSWLS